MGKIQEGSKGFGVPDEFHPVEQLSPFDEFHADSLFLCKLALWNQPQLIGRHQFLPEESSAWEWPVYPVHDPEG